MVDVAMHWAWGVHPKANLIVGYNPKDPKFQGLDQLAFEWAKANGIPGVCYPVNWKKYGRAAGPIRNCSMAALDLKMVLAFPGGVGTADMIDQCTKRGHQIVRVKSPESPHGEISIRSDQ